MGRTEQEDPRRARHGRGRLAAALQLLVLCAPTAAPAAARSAGVEPPTVMQQSPQASVPDSGGRACDEFAPDQQAPGAIRSCSTTGDLVVTPASTRMADVGLYASPALPAPVRRKLVKAHRLALAWLIERHSCRGLFEEIGSDGPKELRYSRYVTVRRGLETSVCESGKVAFTEVGSPVVRLCPGFARLVDRRAAITLIHEALHCAGMSEKPKDPDGLTSDQITRLVSRQCD